MSVCNSKICFIKLLWEWLQRVRFKIKNSSSKRFHKSAMMNGPVFPNICQRSWCLSAWGALANRSAQSKRLPPWVPHAYSSPQSRPIDAIIITRFHWWPSHRLDWSLVFVMPCCWCYPTDPHAGGIPTQHRWLIISESLWQKTLWSHLG